MQVVSDDDMERIYFALAFEITEEMVMVDKVKGIEEKSGEGW